MYYLTLGHSPALSTLELTALGYSPRLLDDHLAVVEDERITSQADRLGGTTRVMQTVQPTSQATFLADLQVLVEQSGAKNHAFTNYTSHPVTSAELSRLKSSLARPVRFLSFNSSGHSLVAIRKQHVAEFSLLEDNGQLVIARSKWIQDADAWVLRDRKRPYQNIKRGMLPPKLARIMVNLATHGEMVTLLDPFCGTGTILMEAALLGHPVVGSDLDPAAVKGSEANLAWLKTRYPKLESNTFHLYSVDAVHVDQHVQAIDSIATEPYLGPLIEPQHLPRPDKLQDIARGLDKLYRGCLRAWHPLLPAAGRVAMVIPAFHLGDKVIPTLGVDAIKRLGYNIESQTDYSQKDAIVVRKITVLTKSEKSD